MLSPYFNCVPYCRDTIMLIGVNNQGFPDSPAGVKTPASKRKSSQRGLNNSFYIFS